MALWELRDPKGSCFSVELCPVAHALLALGKRTSPGARKAPCQVGALDQANSSYRLIRSRRLADSDPHYNGRRSGGF